MFNKVALRLQPGQGEPCLHQGYTSIHKFKRQNAKLKSTN